MASWGKEMKQEYSFYGETDELNWNNQLISKNHLKEPVVFSVDGKEEHYQKRKLKVN